LVRIVEPFDEIQDVAPLLGASKDLVNIVFLALFDVVGLSKNFGGVDRSVNVASSVGFQQQDMEDIMNLPLPREREANGEWVDDFFNLEGAMIFVV
jgi:hypothetical protein